VLEAGVVAAPDGDGLTRARAFVVLKAGWTASEDLAATLTEFVRKRGAAYRTPAAVDFVDALPTTATGKVQRFRLRAPEPA
jgi:benzoate-CoA ligase